MPAPQGGSLGSRPSARLEGRHAVSFLATRWRPLPQDRKRPLTSSAASWPRSSGFSSGNRSSCSPAMVTSWSRSPREGGRWSGPAAESPRCKGGQHKRRAGGTGGHTHHFVSVTPGLPPFPVPKCSLSAGLRRGIEAAFARPACLAQRPSLYYLLLKVKTRLERKNKEKKHHRMFLKTMSRKILHSLR